MNRQLSADATHKKKRETFSQHSEKFHCVKQKKILFLFGRRDNIKRTKQQKSAINFVLFHRGKKKQRGERETLKDKSTKVSFRFLRFDYGN
jgi:hypothetical protein